VVAHVIDLKEDLSELAFQSHFFDDLSGYYFEENGNELCVAIAVIVITTYNSLE
jgi:hypothetical protein